MHEINTANEDANIRVELILLEVVGGPDGTRTRDLRRDRPAF